MTEAWISHDQKKLRETFFLRLQVARRAGTKALQAQKTGTVASGSVFRAKTRPQMRSFFREHTSLSATPALSFWGGETQLEKQRTHQNGRIRACFITADHGRT
jgi:hypothetical protein